MTIAENTRRVDRESEFIGDKLIRVLTIAEAGLRPGRRIQELHCLDAVRFAHDQSNGMEPLEPRHHSAGIVPNQVGVDSVGVQYSLGDVRLDFVGKRPYHRVQLWQFSIHLDPHNFHAICAVEICIGVTSTASIIVQLAPEIGTLSAA